MSIYTINIINTYQFSNIFLPNFLWAYRILQLTSQCNLTTDLASASAGSCCSIAHTHTQMHKHYTQHFCKDHFTLFHKLHTMLVIIITNTVI